MKNISDLAFKSQNTLGRALAAEYDRDRNYYFMDPFMLDLTKVQCSKALRRLKGKTQVISSPGNINVRDRMIHSLEVTALSIQSGARLGLNIPLLQAGAMSHDLGHVPFGHLGEHFISDKLGEKFRHEKFVIFVLEMIERSGEGLNLSYETLQTVLHHSRGGSKMMVGNRDILEEDVVMISDKLAYVFSDFNDICRIGYDNFILPSEMIKLGGSQSERLNRCLNAFWKESICKEKISFEDSDEAKMFQATRDFMYEEVYYKMDHLEDRVFMKGILEEVYAYFQKYFCDNRQAALAIALCSEQDIYELGELIHGNNNEFISEKISDRRNFSIAELLPRIPGLAEFDFCNPDRFMNKKNFGKLSKADCFTL